MKRICFLVLIVVSTNLITAQNNLIGKTFKSKVDLPAKKFDLAVDQITAAAVSYDAVIESGLLFQIVDQKYDKLIVKLFRFKDETTMQAKKYISSGKYLYFLISSDNFSEKTIEPRDILSVGLLTIPFKARLKTKDSDFEFSPEFNLSSTLAFRLSKSWDYSSNLFFQFGAGVGTVVLNEDNSAISSAQNIASLTLLTGFMFDYKGVQVGAYLGWDSISNNDLYKWDYQGKTWISLGIGFGLFDFGSGKNK